MGVEGAAPPVVAVVVARRPGPWFDECLRSLADQDYEALSVLVVTAEPEDVAARVASTYPEAHVAAVPPGATYAQAANVGVDKVDGVAHVLVCHDDVTLAPGAVRLLLEEAYRSNAGLTCPKALMCEEPDRLLSVGLGADHVGVVHAVVERGELDQGQHDAAREVFVAGGGALLARTDLWRALGGFSASGHAGPCTGEVVAQELDLSWRAQLAGARVVVAPQAVVRHREEMEGEAGRARPCDAHRLRAVWSCYGAALVVAMLAVVVALQVSETLWALCHRRPRPLVLAPLAAVPASFRPLASLRRERSRAQSLRRRSDLRLWRMQSRGSARVRSAVRVRVDIGHELASRGHNPRSRDWRLVAGILLGLFFVVVVGSRDLFGALPAAGSLPGTAGGAGGWWSSWWDGQTAGALGGASTPPALAWMYILSLVGFGSAGFAVHMAVIGPLVLGPLGAFVSASKLAGRRAGVVGAVMYASTAVAYNAIAGADWPMLIAYGAAPWLLAAVSGTAPHVSVPEGASLDAASAGGSSVALGGVLREEAKRALRGGLALAVGFAFVPSLALVTLLMGAACAGTAWVGGHRWEHSRTSVLRPLVRSATMTVCALGACLPWSIGVVHSWAAWVGQGPSGPPVSLFSLFGSHLGPYGGGPLGLALVVAACCAIALARSSEFLRVASMCGVAVVMFAAALASARGWARLPDAGVLSAFAAAALAAAVSSAAPSVAAQLARSSSSSRLGWRRLVPSLGAVAVALAPLPLLSWSAAGNWGAPGGAASAYPFPSGSTAGDYRVLWAGSEPAQLPVPAQGNVDGLALSATVDGAGGPLSDQWPVASGPQLAYAASCISLAMTGRTTQLGHLLGMLGTRYLVVPTSTAADRDLVSTLMRQVDLSSVGLSPEYEVFQTSVWAPLLSVTDQRTADALRSFGQPGAEGSAVALTPQQVGQAEALAPSEAEPLPAFGTNGSFSLLVRSPASLFSALPEGTWQVRVDGHPLTPVAAGIAGTSWGPLPAGRDLVSVRRISQSANSWEALVEVMAFALLVVAGTARKAPSWLKRAEPARRTVAQLELAHVPVLEAGSGHD